jgi:hypothetical protein
MKRTSIWLAVVGALILLVPAADTQAAKPDEEIGMVHFASAELDGELLASGDVVLDRELVRTESMLAMVHLKNGQVLKFDANSAAKFKAASFGEIEVTVFSGRVTKWSASGRPMTAGAGSKFTLGRSLQDPLAAERALLGLKPASSLEDKAPTRRLQR